MRLLVGGLVALLVLSAAAGADVVRTSISIDAAKPLGQMKPLWRDFAEGSESADPDYLVSTFDKLRPLRPRVIRTDTTLKFLKIALSDSGRFDIDYSGLDEWIGHTQSIGAQPILCIAYTPDFLSPDGSDISPPKDLKLWEELVYQVVRHVNIDRRFGITYWEAWNEPNHAGFWNGTMQQYFDLYAATVRGALRADPTIKIGGGGYSGSPSEWILGLLDFAKSNELRLDFVSWHDYNVRPEEHKQTARRVDGWLHDRGMDAELMITEWNWHAGLDTGNDNEVGASYAARCLHNMLDSPLDYSTFFEIKDGWKAYERYWGRWGMITYDNHPKAVYYVFQAFSHLTTDRLLLLGGTPNVNGVASRTGDRTTLILYNSGSTKPAVTDLVITGQPNRPLRWRRYLVDGGHSNPAIQGHDSQLEMVSDVSVAAEGGTLKTSLEMAPYSVTLITLEPADGTRPVEALPGLQDTQSRQWRTVARRMQAPPVIDGDLSEYDWRPATAGHDDRLTSIYLGWDPKALYLAVAVREAEFVNEAPDSQLWGGDSIQVGFDPLADARLIDGYNNEDYEYGFALTQRGPVAWCWECPWWKSAGKADDISLAVRRDEPSRTTFYEIAMPWHRLYPFVATQGAEMRVGLLVNDYTPGSERFAVEWGGGIVGWKQPGAFRPVILGN